MIGFWNRKELYVGYSMSVFNEMRSSLAAHHIKYTYKIINRNTTRLGGRGRASVVGKSLEYIYTYYIYVQNKDYEYACKVRENSEKNEVN